MYKIIRMNMTVDRAIYDNPMSVKSSSWCKEDGIRRNCLSPLSAKIDVFNNRSTTTTRNDISLVPPIRQTASIFKQPVTIYKNQESVVEYDLKYGPQEKPKQLFWEKRLEGLRPCDPDGYELNTDDIPLGLKPVGPNVSKGTILQSVATALHIYNHPVTGQTGSRTMLEKNSGVFLNPDQPLIQAISIYEDDIRKQEEKVEEARRKLQDVVKIIS